MKILNIYNNTVKEMDTTTYNWTSGETEYQLAYDNEGELIGIDTEGLSSEILDDIVNNTYAYDFPVDLNEYFK